MELRSTGAQTILPGSEHESMEPVTFDADGEPARVEGDRLLTCVRHLAIAALLCRHWPAKGARHETVLAASGFLLRAGLGVEAVTRILTSAARLADPEADLHIVKTDVVGTAAKLQAHEEVTGGPRLADLLRGDGVKVVALLRRWLGISADERPHLTDTGNAQRFVAACGTHFRYVYAWRAWLAWTETRWERDAGDRAIRRAKETARGIWTEAAQAPDEDRRKAIAKWAAYSESEPGIRRMLALAQSELAITPDQLDADPWLLNCLNGTVELRTGHLRPHRREDFITKITAAPYDPEARSETWDSHLEANVVEPDTIATLQRFSGYSLTGNTTEDRVAFLYGPGGSGKSTTLEAFRRALGDYAETASFETFLHQRRDPSAPNDDIARLRGARMVIAVETDGGRAWAAGIIKHHSGGDSIRARHLHQASFTYTPQYKLWFAANDRPRVDANDEAFWRRLFEVPFPVGRPEETQRNPNIRARLVDPAQSGAAILAWAVEGCVAWLASGLGISPGIREATKAYRTSMDTVAQFLASDRCLLDPTGSTRATSLRAAYEIWCREEGARPVPGKPWATALESAGLDRTRLHGGRTHWIGVSLNAQDEPEWVKGDGR